MRRRDFIIRIAGSAAAWPLVARAQQAGNLPTIGFMGTSTPGAWAEWVAPFRGRLRELGWMEGRNINIEFRWAESRNERFTDIAAEFTHLNVDVIVTAGTGIIAAKRATSVIPIVFALSNDPVGAGLVASLARPGGNITGLSTQLPDLPGKRLQLVLDVVPAVRRLGLMFNVGFPDAVLEMRESRHPPAPCRSRWTDWKSGKLRTSRPPSVRSKIRPTFSMSAPIHSCWHSGVGS